MMHLEITHQDIESLVKYISDFDKEFTQNFERFLQIHKDDYYCYGYIQDCISHLEITITQLEKILFVISHIDKKFSAIYNTIKHIHLAGKITGQNSVYLYGRHRI